MDGRGTGSFSTGLLPATVLENLPYNQTSFDDKLGGATYPFLEQTGRAWRILTHPVDEFVEVHPAHIFGLERPTLRWANGSLAFLLLRESLCNERRRTKLIMLHYATNSSTILS